jgi:signal transduction histidine kinase
VNYVDLLKKQDVGDDTAREYIEVLDRQAARLKKLIEDLLEASKASTGNVSVNLVPLDAAELMKQVAGEFNDRLKEKDLELKINLPEQEIPVLAD